MPKQTTGNWAAEPFYKNIPTAQRQRKYLQSTVNAQLERLEWISNAYRGSYEQGTILLQAVRMNAGRPVSEQIIGKLEFLFFNTATNSSESFDVEIRIFNSELYYFYYLIAETAKYILQTWEPNSVDTPRSLSFVKFVRYIVTQTAFNISNLPLDHAIVMSCVSSSAIPVVCPMIALVIASGYIDRLSKVSDTFDRLSTCDTSKSAVS